MKENISTKQTIRENGPENVFVLLSDTLEMSCEWLLVRENGAQEALGSGEVEVLFEKGKVLLSCLTAEGAKAWRVDSAEITQNNALTISAEIDGKAEKLELIPRISAAELSAATSEARFKVAAAIAGVFVENMPAAKVVSVRLSKGIRTGEVGANAQIIIQPARNRQVAVFAQAVLKVNNPESFLASALSWFNAMSQRARKNPVDALWIAADKKTITKIKKTLALCKKGWRDNVTLFTLQRETFELKQTNIPEFNRLWSEKPRNVKAPAAQIPSETAREIHRLAPEAIDIDYSKHGENICYLGLPFARVRTFLGEEKAWFGTEKKRRVLDRENWSGVVSLVEKLKQDRTAAAENKDHYFYRASPEHWLEAMLRRDITQLDANLILSPIYHQFRASADQIDLLAIRKDGRLVVIELKVTPNREVIFQAANYWRQIELQRRSGNLAEAKIFGEMEIADEPALVYLVAPALGFHRETEFWGSIISPKIEIYCYSLHENWRQNIQVIERRKL